MMLAFAMCCVTAFGTDELLERAFQQDGAKSVLDVARKIECSQGADQAVQSLTTLLRREDTRVQAAAAYALGQMGETGKQALAELASAVSNYEVAHDLQLLGGWLQRLTSDDVPKVRAMAASMLRFLEVKSKDVLDTLVRLVDDPDRDVRVSTLLALEDLAPETILRSALSRLEQDTDQGVRGEAKRILRKHSR